MADPSLLPFPWLPHLALPQEWALAYEQNRIALHVFEDTEESQRIGISEPTIKWLESVNAKDIARRILRDKKMPLLSMTLLPKGVKVKPWDLMGDDMNGYFVNVSENQSHPPRIVAAASKGMHSQSDVYNKNFLVQPVKLSYSPEILAHYSSAPAADALMESLRKTAGGPQGLTHGSSQLNWLAECCKKEFALEGDMIEYNEIILGASVQHVNALAVPFYPSDIVNDDKSRQGLKLSNALRLMDNAINYFHHRARHHNLPIIAYDLNQRSDDMCYMLANTPQQAWDLAENAKREAEKLIAETPGVSETRIQRFSALCEALQNISLQANELGSSNPRSQGQVSKAR